MKIEDPHKIKKIIQASLVGLLFLFIILYANNRTSSLSEGVDLEVYNISNGQVVYEPTFLVEGYALRATKLSLNGRDVAVNSEGFFSDTQLLSPGLNTLTIQAQDRFGKEQVLEYEILYEEEAPKDIDTLISELKETIPDPENFLTPEESLEETTENASDEISTQSESELITN